MSDPKRPRLRLVQKGPYVVRFQFKGATLADVYFDSRDKAEAHALSFEVPMSSEKPSHKELSAPKTAG